MFLFILYFFIAPACAVTAECFSKEHPLGMLIMLGSLQQLHTGLKERGRERKRAFHIHSKLKEAEREWTRENEREGTEREVENKKGCSKKKRTSGADFNTPLKLFICRGSGLEAEEILCLWKYSGTSLNCSNFFSCLNALCIHVIHPVGCCVIQATVHSRTLWRSLRIRLFISVAADCHLSPQTVMSTHPLHPQKHVSGRPIFHCCVCQRCA